MIELGQPAPDFSLTDQAGKTVTLDGCKGTPFILYFYPKDDTPGCTKEACAFRDAFVEYGKRKARIFGVSPDDTASHARFAEKFELPFTLLSDPDHKVCEVYGVWKEKNMYGRKSMGVERTTFVIDAEGVVRAIFPRVRVDGHSDAVIQALDTLR
jgi:thioredoxin-dependent peroxiredoxin